MRLIKYLVPLVLVFLVAISLFATLGLVTAQVGYFVIALWLSIILLIAVILGAVRFYARSVSRLKATSALVSEIKFLQERRYDQLSKRLDYTNDYLRLLRRLALQHGSAGGSSSSTSAFENAQLDEIIARIQRAERRVLGKLEDDIHINQSRHAQVTELLSQVDNSPKKTQES